MKNRTIEIEHKETGSKSRIMPESFSVWEKRGWTLVDDESNDEPFPELVVQDEPGQPDANKE